MNNQKKSKKNMFIIIGMLAVAGIAYFYYSGSNSQTASSFNQTTDEGQQAGAMVLNLLNQIQSLKIDNSLFKDPAYLTLQDYTVQIPEIPIGRTNPFAPLSGESQATKK
jgi:hypothetical protein